MSNLEMVLKLLKKHKSSTQQGQVPILKEYSGHKVDAQGTKVHMRRMYRNCALSWAW